MGSKIALRIAALAIGTAFATVPAFAQQQPSSAQSSTQGGPYLRSDSGPPPAAQRPASGQYYNYSPVAPGPAAGSISWCEQHYRTFDPATGLYRGYDGMYHRCG
jgi:hypothetical protein